MEGIILIVCIFLRKYGEKNKKELLKNIADIVSIIICIYIIIEAILRFRSTIL